MRKSFVEDDHSQPIDEHSKNARPTGNGLGLSIARWIAHAHEGDICVQSTPKLGTVFEVWLPLVVTNNEHEHHQRHSTSTSFGNDVL